MVLSGGRGLEDFRQTMLSDRRIRTLVDYENFKDIFPGVDLAGGACYFLWDRDHSGMCKVINCANATEDVVDTRYLDEYDVFIRSNKALSIIRKVMEKHGGQFMDKTVSASKPFGLRTFYEPQDHGIPCQFIQRIGLKYARSSDVTDNSNLLNKWKFLAPRSPIAGQTDFSNQLDFIMMETQGLYRPEHVVRNLFLFCLLPTQKLKCEHLRHIFIQKQFGFFFFNALFSRDVTRDKF